MLRILGRPNSINVRKVLWLCAELGREYEHEPWGAPGLSLKSDSFLALNPNARVPVIVEDDFVLYESNAICRYLVGQAGRVDLLPAEPHARAHVEQWMDWMATELNDAWRYAFMSLVRLNPGYADRAAIDASVVAWNHHLGMLERQLERTGAFACGAEFTLADIVLGLAVNRWLMTPMVHAELPAVTAYFDRLNERPGFMAHCRNGVP